jgi:hypothetical protein
MRMKLSLCLISRQKISRYSFSPVTAKSPIPAIWFLNEPTDSLATLYLVFRASSCHSHDIESPLQKGLYAMSFRALYPLTEFLTLLPTVYFSPKYPKF